MRGKLGIAALVALVALAGASQATASGGGASEHYGLACDSGKIMCQDPAVNLPGHYIGHDEPSVGFQSNRPGSGNDVTYTVRLPKNPPTRPNQQATGGTWDFQLRPTFWIGMVLCDSQSAPNFTHVCKADSDANNKVSPNPSSPNYIGKHPGNAFMEVQWYSPGYVGAIRRLRLHRSSVLRRADDRQLLGEPEHRRRSITPTANNFPLVGEEPVNWAYITKSGRSQAPANPLSTSRALLAHGESKALNPDPSLDLMMNPGDTIRVCTSTTRRRASRWTCTT